MTERRLFAPELPPEGGEVSLDVESRRHARVLRLAPGAPLTLFDGRGGLATGVLLEGGRCRVDAPTLAPRLVPAL
ncbi:MAG: 16S rRNA (uracil(1498)-N(3))-methyltransferase, partial [Deltaproteobacteria bacterium]|nr:16S rRNA (uracil(1498)-N(3))-methyltransferase [Deltaproteobacteria bacterium]